MDSSFQIVQVTERDWWFARGHGGLFQHSVRRVSPGTDAFTACY